MEVRVASSQLLPVSCLCKLLAYDPETGSLTWVQRGAEWFKDARSHRSWNTKYANKPALAFVEKTGYKGGHVLANHCTAHRVIWAIHYGAWPDGEVDHINGIRTDNRLSNLRLVSRRDNQRNRRRQSNNSSGVTGVSWNKSKKVWRVTVGDKCLGRYRNTEDAQVAVLNARAVLGYHPNHGRG